MSDPPARIWGRILAIADGGDSAAEGDRLRAFRRFLLLYGAARSWIWVGIVPADSLPMGLCAVAMTGAAALSLTQRWEAVAPRLALLPLLVQLGWYFSISANHLFLETFCVAMLCVIDGQDREDERLALQGLRWLTAIVLFQTGVQKLSYGVYFQGEFLAFMVATQERFARIFTLLLSQADVTRLQALDPWQTGAGPFRVDSLPFLLISNFVYLAELGLPVLMMIRRTRRLAAAGACALMAGIQLGALEVGFAFLFLNLLFLFLDANWNRRLLPVFVFILVYAIAAAAGLVPGDPIEWNLL